MKIIYLFLLLVNVSALSQEKFYGIMPMENGRVSYTKIVNADSMTKEVLFAKIKDWAVNTYGSQKVAFDAEDREAGYIAYKGYLPAVVHSVGGILKGKPYTVHIYHTLRFYIRDGKYKVVFDDLYTYNLLAVSILGSTEKQPIEKWGKYKNDNTPKKWLDEYTRDAISMDDTINKLFDSMAENITKGKSAFDF